MGGCSLAVAPGGNPEHQVMAFIPPRTRSPYGCKSSAINQSDISIGRTVVGSWFAIRIEDCRPGESGPTYALTQRNTARKQEQVGIK